MKVLHLSTWKQRCGLADFTENIIAGLSSRGVDSEVFPLDVRSLRYATSGEFQEQMNLFVDRSQEFDLVQVQHEFSLFSGSGGLSESIAHFAHLLSGLRTRRLPAVVTFHTEPLFRDLLPVPGPNRDGRSTGAASFLQWLMRKARVSREISALERAWRRTISPFFSAGPGFSNGPGSIRGLVLTPWTRLTLIRLGADANSISFWPHGVVGRRSSQLAITSAQAKARLGLPADSVVLSVFGFVTRYKGYVLAVDALKRLPPRYHLAIVGGPHPDNPSDLTLDSILASWQGHDPKRLIVTGYAPPETIDLFHAATDICLAPYLPEFTSGSGSICWALTSGKPTVATNIPTFAEIQREAGCFLLCTPNAPHELAWLIQSLTEDKPLQRQLVDHAQQFAARYSWARVTELLHDVYLELTGGAGLELKMPDTEARQIRRAA